MGTPSGSWRRPDPDGRLLGLDADGAAIASVERASRPRFGDRLVLRQANFRELGEVAPEAGFGAVDGLLFDLGLSSFQLADRERGFGFRTGGPLDMRFDVSRGVPAAELLATLDADELTALFRRYGEEPHAGRIARAIVSRAGPAPDRRPPRSSPRSSSGSSRTARRGRRRIHPATRVFQALRIAVNAELDALDDGPRGRGRPAPAGRPARRPQLPLARGPDRQALHRGRAAGLHLPARRCPSASAAAIRACVRSARPSLTAGPAEVAANPRARSARLRAAERLAA